MAELILDIGESASLGRLKTATITVTRTDETTLQFSLSASGSATTTMTIYNLKSNSTTGDKATKISSGKFKIDGLKGRLDSSTFGTLKITGVMNSITYTASLNYTSIRFKGSPINFNGIECNEVYFNNTKINEVYVNGKRVY